MTQEDQRQRFTEVFQRTQHRIYGLCVTLLGSRHDADGIFPGRQPSNPGGRKVVRAAIAL